MAHGYASRSFALGGTTTATDPEPWVRPADWLSLGEPQTTTQRIRLLVAVFPGDSSYLRLDVTGAFTVDWGDGAGPTNFASGVPASKQFMWAQHAGTDSTRGYRQAVVTVTPQAGNQLVTFSTAIAHAVFGALSGVTTPILEIEGFAPNLTTFQLSANAGTPTRPRMLERCNLAGPTQLTSLDFAFSSAVRLQVVSMDTSKCTGFASTFNACSSLQAGPALDTSAGTSFNATFAGCSGMRTVPLYDTSKATNTANMLQNCSALQTVPLFNLSLVTNANSMFSGCVALTSLPLFDLGNVTDLGGFIQGCRSLTTFPAWNTSKNTSMATFAANCSNLVSIPAIDTSKATSWASAFASCARLATIPTLDASACTTLNATFSGCASLRTAPTLTGLTNCLDMTQTFLGCSALQTVPLYDTSRITGMSQMFTNCVNLQTVPAFNTALVTNVSNMFSGCVNLVTVPAFNWSAVSSAGNVANVFNNTGNITSIAVTGLRFALSVVNNLLNAAALDALYTNLGTAAGSQAVTVSGNPGVTGDTPTIATAKGWTVSGS